MFKQLRALFTNNTQDKFTEPDKLELSDALDGLLSAINTAYRNEKDALVVDLCDMLNQVLVDYINDRVAPVYPYAADAYRAWVGKFTSAIVFGDEEQYMIYANYIDRVLKIGEAQNV